MNTTTTTTTITLDLPEAPALRTCTCGCGINVAGAANYRPGHDAKHAGQIARAVAINPADALALLSTLPTRALQLKARDHATRLIAEAELKSAREAEKKAKADVKPAPKATKTTAKTTAK